MCLSLLLFSKTLVDKQCLCYLGFLSEQQIFKILSLKNWPDTLLTRNRKLTRSRLLPTMQKSKNFPVLYFLILKEILLSDLKFKAWFMKRLRLQRSLGAFSCLLKRTMRIGLWEWLSIFSKNLCHKMVEIKIMKYENWHKRINPSYNHNLVLSLVWLSTSWCWLAVYLRPLKLFSPPLQGAWQKQAISQWESFKILSGCFCEYK